MKNPTAVSNFTYRSMQSTSNKNTARETASISAVCDGPADVVIHCVCNTGGGLGGTRKGGPDVNTKYSGREEFSR